ncbi:hypothetical protein ABIE21_002099 [Conyzicola nivalis]|uniref:ABC transporter n=1 Tax=Conyzicola nivalis TaxID=1477021 RepID=A0ABV2QNG1_9MICO
MRTLTAAVAVTTLLTLAACSSAAPQGTAPTGHGYVEGASEMQEPQLRLATLDGAGVLWSFDLVSGETAELTADAAAESVSTDGRFVYTANALRGSVRIVDAGAWTVPHGDHSHYYLAEPRVVGDVDGGRGAGAARVSAGTVATAVWFGDVGTGIVLDTDALADGEPSELARIETAPHDGVLVPIGRHLVGSVAAEGDGRASSLVVYDLDGEPVAGATADCPDAGGAATTRVGVVVACADGVVLATETGEGAVAFETIAYPDGTPADDVATAFAGRPGRPDVAAIAGERGAWLLDSRARTVTLVASPEPLLRANAVGDDARLIVAVGASGRLHVLSAAGTIAQTEPLLAPDIADGLLTAGVTVEVDISRAYVNSPAAGVVYEIDYADDARVARTLDVPGAALMVETGR